MRGTRAPSLRMILDLAPALHQGVFLAEATFAEHWVFVSSAPQKPLTIR
jgi:hypothetical protein